MRSQQVGNDTENCATGFFPGRCNCRVFLREERRICSEKAGQSYVT